MSSSSSGSASPLRRNRWPRDLEQHHDRRVVGTGSLGAAAVRRRDRDRAEDGPGQRADASSLAQRRHRHRHARVGCPALDRRRPVGWIAQRAGLDLCDLAAIEHTRQAVDMIGVEMGEDDEGDAAYSQQVETVVHRDGVGAGVDDNRSAATGVEHHAVALPDVAHHQHPAPRRPAQGAEGVQHDNHQQDAARHRCHRAHQDARQHQHNREADHRQCREPDGTDRPTEAGSGVRRAMAGRPHDPPRRYAGQPSDQMSRGIVDEGHEAGDQTANGRRSDRGRCQHVGEHRHQGDLT